MKQFKRNIAFGTASLAISMALSSCSVLKEGNVANAYVAAYAQLRSVILDDHPDFISSAYIKQIPYASSKVKIGRSAPGLLILEEKDKDITTWVSSDEARIVLNRGKIIETSGLGNNLIDLVIPDFKFSEVKDGEEFKYVSYYSYENPLLENLRVTGYVNKKGSEKISILDKDYDLLLFEEVLINEEINWKVINKYWVDPEDYFVWKSEQYFSPRQPVVIFEITKRPKSAS